MASFDPAKFFQLWLITNSTWVLRFVDSQMRDRAYSGLLTRLHQLVVSSGWFIQDHMVTNTNDTSHPSICCHTYHQPNGIIGTSLLSANHTTLSSHHQAYQVYYITSGKRPTLLLSTQPYVWQSWYRLHHQPLELSSLTIISASPPSPVITTIHHHHHLQFMSIIPSIHRRSIFHLSSTPSFIIITKSIDHI